MCYVGVWSVGGWKVIGGGLFGGSKVMSKEYG